MTRVRSGQAELVPEDGRAMLVRRSDILGDGLRIDVQGICVRSGRAATSVCVARCHRERRLLCLNRFEVDRFVTLTVIGVQASVRTYTYIYLEV